MNRESIGRPLMIAFVGAVILYAVTFYSIEHLRTRKGGWQVTFKSDAAGVPAVTVSQPQLGISNVTFLFPGHVLSPSPVSQTIAFDRPITNVPFGKVIYFDTTFLPGSVVLQLFGHEIQLLPRVLTVDHEEIPWRSGSAFVLSDKHTLPAGVRTRISPQSLEQLRPTPPGA